MTEAKNNFKKNIKKNLNCEFVTKRICTLKKLKIIFIIAQNRRKTFNTYTKRHMKVKP